MPADPRSLIVRLMPDAEARGDATLGVRELISACALFNLPENRVRGAFARAVATGQLSAPRRGAYALSPDSRPLADEVSRWRDVEKEIVEWRGDWPAVHAGATGRSIRPALRARERAFGILGLAEFERALHLRPNNLAGGVASLRERLAHLVPPDTGIGTVLWPEGLDTARFHTTAPSDAPEEPDHERP